MIRRFFAITILVALLLIMFLGAYVYAKRTNVYPQADATLHVQTGTAAILSPAAAQVDVATGKDHPVKAGDSVKTTGWSTLSVPGIEIDLTPGTELTVTVSNAQGSDAQTEVTLKAGQILQRVSGFTSSKSYSSVVTGDTTLSTRGGEFLARLLADGTTQVANGLGSTTVTAGTQKVVLQANQGISVKKGEALPDPAPWSQVTVHTYKPDGSAILLPGTLINEKSHDQFNFASNSPYLVPEGIYTLKLQGMSVYETHNVDLKSGSENDIAVTLSEVVFELRDASGNPQPYTALTVKGDELARAIPETPVILLPGKSSLIVSREEDAEQVQPVDLTAEPGQRVIATVRSDLFGGGRINVDIGKAGENPEAPVTVAIYTPGNEDGDPLVTFKSDSPSPVLPAGDYAVSVRTQLAGRYIVTVPHNKTVTLSVPLGYLDISYTDAQGKPVSRNAFIFVASVAEMARLNKPIDQMRQTLYGLGVQLATTNRILVPAGTYNVMIDDRKDVVADNVEVQAGQTTPLEMKVAP